jgi:hypothetical protein
LVNQKSGNLPLALAMWRLGRAPKRLRTSLRALMIS